MINSVFRFPCPVGTPPAHCGDPGARPELPEQAGLAWRTASTGLGVVKWAAAAGLLASAAGLGPAAAASWAAGAVAVGGVVWIGEMASIRYGFQLPHVTLQHALCNELHTLAGGLLGATPVAAALTALGAAMAAPNAAGVPEVGYNGLAMLSAIVACPMVLLLSSAARATEADPSSGIGQLIRYGLPLAAAGAALVAPAVVLQAAVSPEAATRFVIVFGAGMACAAVREGLTQATTRAWGGLERNGVGANYGLSQARGADRAASTMLPTAASCLLFTVTTGLLVHQLDAWYDLGIAPAGQSVLTMSAAETARRTALRYTLMQSTNELLEGIARCLPLAGYARVRGIPLRYRNDDAGIHQIPAQLRRNLADPETLRRAALFASARTLDGGMINILGQLSTVLSPDVFWNGFRVAAMLAQGATMARTPIIAAWLLPGEEPDDDSDDNDACAAVVTVVPAAIDCHSNEESASTSSPQSDASVRWA